MDIRIADITITRPFRVYDITTGHFIFSVLDVRTAPGDIPPDVAVLPVVGVRAVDNVLYIDVRT